MSSLPKNSHYHNSIGLDRMVICNEIIGNIADKASMEQFAHANRDEIMLDQWTAQKSRFVIRNNQGEEYAVALQRHHRLRDGDIIAFDARANRITVVRLDLNEVMVIDLGALIQKEPDDIIHIAIELGHALGNQHWPAVVKGCKVYVPLTVDKKVMESVMQTHDIEDIEFEFRPGAEIIPYLAPHEIRRLFGGAERGFSDSHHHEH